MSEESRLNKFISASGLCSRREADRLIEDRRVRLNGRIAQTGDTVGDDDVVEVDGRRIHAKADRQTITLAFNKPEGITCTTDESIPGNIISFLKLPYKAFPIGRLDKMSQGLIFITNDGDLVNKILRAGNAHEKEYLVGVDRQITPDFLQRMRQGVRILDTVTQACQVTQTGPQQFKIILTQGLNRQIRRMCEVLGYAVLSLQRLRIMNVHLGSLKLGAWRRLSSTEMAEIARLTASSSKTQEASVVKTQPAKTPAAPVPDPTAKAPRATVRTPPKAPAQTPKKALHKAPALKKAPPKGRSPRR